jgi:hypothetical protein
VVSSLASWGDDAERLIGLRQGDDWSSWMILSYLDEDEYSVEGLADR